MKTVTVDFETYFDKEYSLSKKHMTTEKYIRDDKFKVHGAGIKIGRNESLWVSGKYLPKAFEKLELHKHMLVGHNLQFDGAILAWRYGIYPSIYADTLGMSRAIIGPSLKRFGLKYVSEYLVGMTKMAGLEQTLGKINLTKDEERRLSKYCVALPTRHKNSDGFFEAGDTEMTYAIFREMIPYLPKHELLALDWTIRTFTNPELFLDTDLLKNYYHEVVSNKKQTIKDAGLEDRKVLMSNPKFAEALEELDVVPPTKINAKGQVKFAFAKTDEGLKKLTSHPDPRVQTLVAARLANKSTIEETRSLAYWDASRRGAWPAAYNYSGAMATHRYSGNKGGGGNPQNMTRGGTLRKAVYAPSGYRVGVADLSQIECRATLWFGMQFSGPDGEEAKALKIMEEGGDIYSYFGGKIYGVEISKATHPIERQIAKSAVLGLGYGMGKARFLEYCLQMGIPMDEFLAADVVSLYRKTFTGVVKFWRHCQKSVAGMIEGVYETCIPTAESPTLITKRAPITDAPSIKAPSGLYIKYPGLKRDAEGQMVYDNKGIETKLFGGKIAQNIMECVTSEMMRNQVTEMSKKYPVKMVTHDELVCLIPEEDEDTHKWDPDKGEWEKTGDGEFSKFAVEVMTKPVPHMPGLPVGIESDTAIRYGDAK